MTQTSKEYKFPIMPFIGSVYVLWKPHPEEGDRHWVIIQNPVPSNPPEPATLKKQNNIHLFITPNRKMCGFVCFVGKVQPSSCRHLIQIVIKTKQKTSLVFYNVLMQLLRCFLALCYAVAKMMSTITAFPEDHSF